MNHIFSGNQKNIKHKSFLPQTGQTEQGYIKGGGKIVDEAEIKGDILLGVNFASNLDIEWLIVMKGSIEILYNVHGKQILP